MENAERHGWKVSNCGAFFDHETGMVRVNRSYDDVAKRPFRFAVRSKNGFWIGQAERNFKTSVAAMKAAEAHT